MLLTKTTINILNIVACLAIIGIYTFTYHESISVSFCILSPTCNQEKYGYAGVDGFDLKDFMGTAVSFFGSLAVITLLLHNPRKTENKIFEPENLRDAGILPQKGKMKEWIVRGITGIIIYYVVASSWGGVFEHTPESIKANQELSSSGDPWAFFSAGTAGFEEELLLIPTVMLATTVFSNKKRFIVLGVIVAGVLRFLFHAYYGWGAAWAIPLIWVLPAVLLWLWSKNSWTLILTHGLGNLSGMNSAFWTLVIIVALLASAISITICIIGVVKDSSKMLRIHSSWNVDEALNK